MIEEETLFILGAGASVPYGYPTGAELREEICFRFKSIFASYIATYNHVQAEQYNEYVDEYIPEFCNTFYKSSTPSIDLFLARKPDYKRVGKLGLICCLNEYEKESSFREETKKKDQDWYSNLYQRMSQKMIKPENYKEMIKNKVNFITFNYDRSLEYFLYESFNNSFSVPKDEIKEIFIKLKVEHVFGKIVSLPWQDNNGVGYAKINNFPRNIIELIKNIKIIYEENNQEVQQNIISLINKAERIFILGFGFAEENLKILDFPNSLQKHQSIYATAYGMTKKEINDIRKLFHPDYLKTNRFHIEDCDSLTLLREYL